MKKDFNSWNTLKQGIELHTKKVYANQREIWWSSIGINIGSESCGKNNLFERPVLILKVISKDLLLVAPLSTKNKNNKYHIEIDVTKGKSYLLLEHIKTMSTKRLTRKIDRVSKDVFKNVCSQYKNLL